jgi:dipeptidase
MGTRTRGNRARGTVSFGVLTAVALLMTGCGLSTEAPSPDPSDGDGLSPRSPAEKSIAFYVGRNLTDDGTVLLGGFGHEPSSHWIEITPAHTFPVGTRLEVGVTEQARFPGERIRIPQVEGTARFVTSNYSEFAGFPQPLTNGGLNEHLVAARTVWSPSRAELVAMTPDPQRGLSYSDLARIVMERATRAREAAAIVGELVEAHGYATYGGNSFLFADPNEGWVVITYAGGQRLWAAERLGPDQVRVLYPGHIRNFPADFQEDPDYMGASHLVDFAVGQGWFDPEDGKMMDLQEVYGRPFPSPPGEEVGRFRYPPDLEEELRSLSPVSLPQLIALVRDPRWSDDPAGYGQAVALEEGMRGEVAALWISVSPAVAAPMVPVLVGAADVPPEYKQHRYMTKGAGSTFLDPEFAALEATRSAYRTFRRLLYHTCSQPESFLRPVTGELEEFEARRMEELPGVQEAAGAMLRTGDDAGARSLLTEHVEAWLLEALALGERLVEAVEGRARDRAGVQMPDRPVPEGATWRPESGPMALPSGAERLHCHVPGLESYPRPHGSNRDLVGSLVR